MFPGVLDIFKVGVGPSSSHTVGPMVAARNFALWLDETGALAGVTRVRTELFGSLGATGYGHGSHVAVLAGLTGAQPATVDPALGATLWRQVRRDGWLTLLDEGPSPRTIDVDPADDMVLHIDRALGYHPNAMTFTAFAGEAEVAAQTWYSIGGGFVVLDDGTGQPATDPSPIGAVPHPFRTGEQLVDLCHDLQRSPARLMFANEATRRGPDLTRADVLGIWQVMNECIDAGCLASGVLPGGLFLPRRAKRLHDRLLREIGPDPLGALDWVTCWALAVNEQNAAGGRVVTAPTNGAAGIIPAVGRYGLRFLPGWDDDAALEYLLTAAAIGAIFKSSGSISGAEVGCQGEVGTACAMAAAGLAHAMGGTAQQVVNAAEIGLEHHLGLTCDPVAGLVQVPCIERNAMASINAITAARMAIADDGHQFVSLDECVRTMMQTGLDMQDKYKETSRGGLAVAIANC